MELVIHTDKKLNPRDLMFFHEFWNQDILIILQ